MRFPTWSSVRFRYHRGGIVASGAGIAVGELTHLRIEAVRRARRRDYTVSRIHRVAELVRSGATTDDVLFAIDTELGAELGTDWIELRPGPPDSSRLELTHTGVVAGVQTDRFPDEGVDVSVGIDGDPAYQLRLHPGPHARVTDLGSLVAVVMADILGATLSEPARHRRLRRTTADRDARRRARTPGRDCSILLSRRPSAERSLTTDPDCHHVVTNRVEPVNTVPK